MSSVPRKRKSLGADAKQKSAKTKTVSAKPDYVEAVTLWFLVCNLSHLLCRGNKPVA